MMPDFTQLIEERTRQFTGREWVFRAVDQWLGGGSGGRIFLLTGGPGTGKTAIAARVAQMHTGVVESKEFSRLRKDCLAYFHFCQAGSDATLAPLRFVEALAALGAT
jgi:SpoVK/Ycf46/Vps4 family AAA+-type ATPase